MGPLAMMAIGGAAGGLSSLFDRRDKGGFELIPSTPEQDEARRFLLSLMSGGISIPTREIAGMSESERRGIELLNQFLGQPESPERATALSFLTGILDQPVDVTQLPEIKALMSSIESETGDLVSSAMRRTQLAGMGTSGPQGAAVGRELARGKTSMVAALAPYMAGVRSNQLTAANLINSLVSGAEGSALGKIGAATTYGALPRTIEQARADAELESILENIRNRYGAAGGLLGETRYMYDPGTTSPSPFMNILQGVTAGANLYGTLQQAGTNKLINQYLQGQQNSPYFPMSGGSGYGGSLF